MDPELTHSGDLSQQSVPTARSSFVVHRKDVPESSVIDPAARVSKGAYRGLSSMSVGLELGIAVLIGLLFGMYLDGELGTTPWLMLVFLGLGFAAGFRGVLRAVSREDREAARG